MVSFGLLLDVVCGVGDGGVVALEACEMDSGDVSGVFEEVGDFVGVDDLAAVGVAPVETVVGSVFGCDDRVALGCQAVVVILDG